jgi:hypothetical protein
MNYAPSASTVASIGLGIPIATVAAWLLTTCCHVDMPAEVQAAMGALIGAIIGYLFNGGRHTQTVTGSPATQPPP